MFAPNPRRFALFALLALSMAATRFGHVGSVWLPPDASWAVFFLGGFYLGREWRWALGALLIDAVAVDCLAVRNYGVSNYCVTLAYWFIVPAYSVLWLGGAWLRRHYQQVPLDLARLLASLMGSVTVCYLLTTGASTGWEVASSTGSPRLVVELHALVRALPDGPMHVCGVRGAVTRRVYPSFALRRAAARALKAPCILR